MVDELLPDVLAFPAGTDLHDFWMVKDGTLILQVRNFFIVCLFPDFAFILFSASYERLPFEQFGSAHHCESVKLHAR